MGRETDCFYTLYRGLLLVVIFYYNLGKQFIFLCIIYIYPICYYCCVTNTASTTLTLLLLLPLLLPQEYVDAEDPDAGIEEEYHPKKNKYAIPLPTAAPA